MTTNEELLKNAKNSLAQSERVGGAQEEMVKLKNAVGALIELAERHEERSAEHRPTSRDTHHHHHDSDAGI